MRDQTAEVSKESNMRVLVWTSSDIMSTLVEIVVRDEGLDPVMVSRLDAARYAVALGACDIVVSDLHMGPGQGGCGLMEEIDRISPCDRPTLIPIGDTVSSPVSRGPVDLRALRLALRTTSGWSYPSRAAC